MYRSSASGYALRFYSGGRRRDLNRSGNLAGLDLQLVLSGTSLDNLYPLLDVVLPATPPYQTEGHLSARLKQAGGAVYHYENFNGKIGDSDIHGDLTYTDSQPRPKLAGQVDSEKLRFTDLAPLIGADSIRKKPYEVNGIGSRAIRSCRQKRLIPKVGE